MSTGMMIAATIMGLAFIGIICFGLSILHSISQRSKPLVKQNAPPPKPARSRTTLAQYQDILGDYYDAGAIGKPPRIEEFRETDTPPRM